MCFQTYQLQGFAPLVANLWTNTPPTNIEFWLPVMQSSVVVQKSRMTTIVNMKLTIGYDMGLAIPAPAFWNIFVIKPVKEAANQIETPFFAVTDDVQMSDYPGRQVTLNPGKFNVLRTCYETLSLTPLAKADTLVDNANYAGDPGSTLGERVCNFKLNTHVEQP